MLLSTAQRKQRRNYVARLAAPADGTLAIIRYSTLADNESAVVKTQAAKSNFRGVAAADRNAILEVAHQI